MEKKNLFFFFLFFFSSSFFFFFINGCTLPTGIYTTETGEGIVCEECNYNGYLDENGICVCLSWQMDPSQECQLVGVPTVELNLTFNYFKASCDCYHNFTHGFWTSALPPELKLVNGSWIYIYGYTPPPVCNQCFNRFYGPPPEQRTYSLKGGLEPACNQLGGVDPQLLRTSAPTSSPNGNQRRLIERSRELVEPAQGQEWVVCAGHGGWNSNLHGCDCDTAWELQDSGRGYNSSIVYLCNTCNILWGPPPPFQQNTVPYFNLSLAYCSQPFTPDVLDGFLKPCGGHGDFINGECVCYTSPELGYWRLATYSQEEWVWRLTGVEEYSYLLEEFTAETCSECAYSGSTIEEGCVLSQAPTLPTLSPTFSPTDNPTKKPTRSPTVPTKSPTESPTRNPTRTPTLNPTTHQPTRKPTSSPTLNPTTKKPTFNPTHNPTLNPTIKPTTKKPTLNPTKNPTRNPTLTRPTPGALIYSGATLYNGNFNPGSSFLCPHTRDPLCELSGLTIILASVREGSAYTGIKDLLSSCAGTGGDYSAPVYGPTGTIANSINDFFTSNMLLSPQQAGVTQSPGNIYWWSGATTGGGPDSTRSCVNTVDTWTTASPSSSGLVGCITCQQIFAYSLIPISCDQTAQVLCCCKVLAG